MDNLNALDLLPPNKGRKSVQYSELEKIANNRNAYRTFETNLLIKHKIKRKTVYDMTFEEEKEYNSPINTLRRPLQQLSDYGFIDLSEEFDFKFVNTDIVRAAALHFQKYRYYCPYDPIKEIEKYTEYWDRWEYRRKFGMTVPIGMPLSGANSDDDIFEIWIPPKMVGFLNFSRMSKTNKIIDDDVKDTEEMNKEKLKVINSSHKPKDKNKELIELMQSARNRVVVDTEENFPDFWDGHFYVWRDLYIGEKLGYDNSIVKARRKGFSYIGGWDAFDEIDMNPSITVALVAYDEDYLNSGDGLFNMLKTNANFVNVHTDWAKNRIIDNTTELKFGYEIKGIDGTFGYKSTALAVGARNNPSCLRGKKLKKIKWEEVGSFPNFIETVEATSAAAEAGNYTVGHSTYWGTVGSKDSEYASLSQVHYNPKGYNVLPYKNVFDKETVTPICGMFYPQSLNYLGAIDKDGNSDRALANQLHMEAKEKKRLNAKAEDFAQWNAERAEYADEALKAKTINIFNKDLIQSQIERIRVLKKAGKIYDAGLTFFEDNRVVFRTNTELQQKQMAWHEPLFETFRKKDMDVHGAVVVYNRPYQKEIIDPSTGFSTFEVPAKMYAMWVDPYSASKDKSKVLTGDSLGAAYVFELPNTLSPTKGMRIAASFVGRPADTKDFNRQVLNLAIMYNCVGSVLFERNIGDTKAYFELNNALKYLMKEPAILSPKEVQNIDTRPYGIRMNDILKAEGAKKLRDLLEKVTGHNYEDEPIQFIRTVLDIGLLEECLKWDMEGNFDRVSAWIVGTYVLEEFISASYIDYHKETEKYETSRAYNNDFWSRNFF